MAPERLLQPGVSVTHRYHQSTKYDPRTISAHPGLDWDRQPEPFKTFHSTSRVDLSPHVRVVQDELTSRLLLPRDELEGDLDRLSTLLLHVNGVTARRESPGTTTWYRAAPSAGALYPTEIYVATRGVDGLADGLYDFQVREHDLAPVCEGDFWGDLSHAAFGHPAVEASRIVVLFSAVFFRSSWRYHDRAYRRILLDTGHVVGNLCSFAPEVGLHPVMLGAFDDAAVNSLLLFDEDEEAMLAIAPLVEDDRHTFTSAAAAQPIATPPTSDDLIVAVHRAGYATAAGEAVAHEAPSELHPEAVALEGPGLDWEDRRSDTILRRRSNRQLTAGPVPVEELSALLADSYESWPTDGDEGRRVWLAAADLETYVVVQRVTGLEPGVYRFDPAAKTLTPVQAGQFDRVSHEVTLGQDLAKDAAAVIIHTADLDQVVERFGDRGYRYLSLDAGHVGQRMNLAAVRLGLGVSGIGGYFDDLGCDLCKLPRDRAIVYITCVGQPPTEL